jgi:replication factor A1
MKFKVADDTYNDETRVKVSIAKIEPVAFVAESKRMLEQIKKLEAGENIDEPRPAARAPSMGGGGAGLAGGGAYGGGGAAGGGGGFGGDAGGWNQGGGGGGNYGGGGGW